MSEEKVIVFRSRYERFICYCGQTKIRFTKHHYRTADQKEIEFLRKLSEKRTTVSEIKPERKMVPVFIEGNETEEAALEKALNDNKKKTIGKSEAKPGNKAESK